MFTLTPSFVAALRQFIKEADADACVELEFRFSTVEPSVGGTWKPFEPVVDAGTFQRTLSGYLSNAPAEAVRRETTHEHIFPSGRETRTPEGMILRKVRKRCIQKRDMSDYNFRMSLSSEDDVTSRGFSENVIMVRKKNRVSIFDQVVKYDFTTVWTQKFASPDTQHGRLSYEVEMEYIGRRSPDRKSVV